MTRIVLLIRRFVESEEMENKNQKWCMLLDDETESVCKVCCPWEQRLVAEKCRRQVTG
jgi:hypothetical protein